MLERPLHSPVEESEFVVFGVKEWQRAQRSLFFAGILFGLALAVGIMELAAAWRVLR